MARIRTDFVRGTITNDPLAIDGTTLNSAALASLPAISSPDIAVLILDPTASAPEVVHVTAHTSSATTATILRGRESSVARSHIQGTAFVHGATSNDFDIEGTTVLATGVTDGYVLTADGAGASAWEALPTKDFTEIASSLTEVSFTSTSKADLVVLTPATAVPAATPLLLLGSYRKTAGAAVRVEIGLKVNATEVFVPTTQYFAGTSTTDRVERGSFWMLIMPRVTNYDVNVIGESHARYVSSGTIWSSAVTTSIGASNIATPFPTAAVTSVTLNGEISGAGGITGYIDEVHLYALGAL